eukprot:TRINITY_DN19416_c0_g1_i1.p1 TRINITY_DN19416_c0_g1~~TRINITY_DN19416_c0_g1_i1.p1  ORF type:complete len:445 (+),score=93.40 TRINITY_DN19416_c0_g1_i1:245-1579(+)
MNHPETTGYEATARQPRPKGGLFGFELGTSLSLADHESLRVALKEYKYVAPNLSLFEIIWLDKFWLLWQRAVYPSWLAPNVITFIGFIFVMISFLTMLFLSPELDGSCPKEWFIFTAITCFLYQTLDGSDGKQARATKSGSPLGELFDHGVDALVTPIIVAFTIEIQGFGIGSNLGLLAIVLSQSAFCMSNLTLLHLGKQEFNTVDCQEVQVVVQCALLITAFFPHFWTTEFTIPFRNITWLIELLPLAVSNEVMVPGKTGTLQVRGFVMFWSVCCMSWNVVRGVFSILAHYVVDVSDNNQFTTSLTAKSAKEGQGIRSFVHQLTTLGLYALLNWLGWRSAASVDRISSNPLMPVCWLVLSCYSFGDLMDHVLFTRVGQLPFPSLPFRNRGLWLLAFFWLFFGHDEIVYAITVFAFISHTQYAVTMGSSVCKALRINFFTIKRP